jgi:hypothetical protein
MAQTYTLEEAAARLGLSGDDLKRRLREDWKSVRSFRDGATLRFRASDIDELARTLGQASDPGLPLGESPSPLSDDSSDELIVPLSAGKEKPVYLSDDSDDIFALPTPEGSGKGKGKGKPKAKGDSDVRLDVTPPKAAEPGANNPTEEISLDLGGPTSGVGLGKSGSKLTGPKSSGKLKGGAGHQIPSASGADDGSSEFELSLDADSDSFELQLTNDSSEEDALSTQPVTGSPGARSGINLGKPADSGVSIEKKGKKPNDSDSDIDFELSVDGPSAGQVRSMAGGVEEGSSEFELTLDDSSGSESMNALASAVQEDKSGDIFETDFELPVMADDESGSEVVPVDSADTDLENSDFDLAISDADAPADDESASQVVLMDEDAPVMEDEPQARRRSNRLAGADLEDDDVFVTGGSAEGEPVRTVAAPPAKWGLLPLLMLAPTFVLAMLGGLMAYELVRGMAGYQQPGAASAPLVRGMAGMFGLKTGD